MMSEDDKLEKVKKRVGLKNIQKTSESKSPPRTEIYTYVITKNLSAGC